MPPEQVALKAMPAGTLIEGVGGCDLPVTTTNAKAKELTLQGFALIHCFWFNEAVRSFRDATKEDPSCATAWLGLAISETLPWHRPGNLKKEADYAIERAVALSGTASDIEQEMIAAFRLRSLTREDRGSEFEKKLDALILRYPDKDEPRLLLAAIRVQLCLSDGYDAKGDPASEMKKVAALIDAVIKRHPDNAGAHHYWIHANEGMTPDLAVGSADVLGKLAPASSHMVHMPGHIYNRVGMYSKAHEVFSASTQADKAYYPKVAGSDNNTNWNYGHNLAYTSSNLAEMGRIKEAISIYPNSKDEVMWRAGRWAEISGGSFEKGMAAVAAGDLAAAREALGSLDGGEESEKTPSFQRTRARVEAAKAHELRGSILAREGKNLDALKELESAVAVYDRIAYEEPPYYVRLPHESLGEFLIETKQFDRALEVYRRGLKARPNSGWLLFGIARAHEKAGQREEAEKAYREFLAAWPGADEDLVQVKAAREFLSRSAVSRKS